MLNWIKEKLKKWLEVVNLEKELNVTRKEILELNLKIIDLEHEVKAMDIQLYRNQEAVKEFSKMIEVGVDLGVRDYHRNWAIFAVQGNGQDYIKFIDLSNLDYREIKEWQKRLESIGVDRGRFKYDAPMGIKDLFQTR